MTKSLKIKSVDSGGLGRTLQVHDLPDGESGNDAGKRRVTIEDTEGNCQSIVVMEGDLIGAVKLTEDGA
jgi:hypothetical protein